MSSVSRQYSSTLKVPAQHGRQRPVRSRASRRRHSVDTSGPIGRRARCYRRRTFRPVGATCDFVTID